MSDSRMKWFNKIQYDTVDLMLGGLRPGKFYKAWGLVMQYARATETGNLDAPVPVSGDPAIDGFVRVLCDDVRDKTKAYFEKVVPANKRNAETRWEAKADQADKGKGKSKAAKQDKAEAKAAKQEKPNNAPVTLEDFIKMGGNGPDSKLMEKLYRDLVAANWIYHGFDLREYYAKCIDHYESMGKKWRCGLMAVIGYNAHRNFLSDKPRFDAICDLAIAEKWEGGLCSVCELMEKTRSYSIGGVWYEGKNYDSIEKFIEFLKNF